MADFSTMKPLYDIEQAMFVLPASIVLYRFEFPFVRAFVERFKKSA